MKIGNCRKNETYHQLLVSYIDGIGTSERPAGDEEILIFSDDGTWMERARTVGQVEAREGAWDLYLIRIAATGPYRMVRRQARRFYSRQIACIVAKYLTLGHVAEAMPLHRDREQGFPPVCLN